MLMNEFPNRTRTSVKMKSKLSFLFFEFFSTDWALYDSFSILKITEGMKGAIQGLFML